MYDEHVRTLEEWEAAERTRVKRLAIDQAEYAAACESRRQEAAQVNDELDTLISGLAFDVPEAIEEYVGIVLSNSVYPETFPVEHDFDFDLATRELDLRATILGPDEVPTVKEYKWAKTSDEITTTKLTLKAQRDRYSSAVAQVAVRTLHEVFEADRHGRIHSISLIVQVHRISPATGLAEDVPLVAVAADRDRFATFDLTQVDPAATIGHLGGVLSKKPWELLAVDPAGVRGAGTS